MKSWITVLLATAVAAAPAPQFGGLGGGSTANDFDQGPCKPVFLVVARGSTEPGNIGPITGAPLCAELKKKLGEAKVGCQGVPYPAGIMENVIYAAGKGTSDSAIQQGVDIFNKVAAKCPESKIVFSGYSQGGALMTAAVSILKPEVKAKVVGGILYGSTKHQAYSGSIPNYPKEAVLGICEDGDGICHGTLAISAAHMAYISNGSAAKAADFLVGRVGSV